MSPNDTKVSCKGPEEVDVALYEPRFLKQLDWSGAAPLKNAVTSHNPGEGLLVRPLMNSDFDKGFPHILAQLTDVGEVSRANFEERFNLMKRCPGHYFVTVIEDTTRGKIIAAATLAVELKFIRGCCKRGRLEDVVVDDSYRGKQLGKLIVSTIVLLGKSVGCYKITLDCKDTMREFYTSLGFKSEPQNDKTMVIRY